MKIDFPKALVAGVAGTFAFDVAGLAITGEFWDIPGMLSAKLALPLAVGVALHYVIGFTLAAIYAAVAPSLPGGRWGRPALFITAETVLGVWLFMAPLLGAGPLGLGLGVLFPVISLVRHLVFGALLGWLYPVEAAPTAHPATA